MPFEATHNSSQELSQDRQPRYLRANIIDRSGFRHQWHLLRHFLIMAHHLNRIAVIPSLDLKPHHNAQMPVDGNPLLYINLDRSTISDNGKQRPIRYILEANFDENRFMPNQVLHLSSWERTDISASDNARYALITFNLTLEDPAFVSKSNKRSRNISVSLAPSDMVRDMSQQVIQNILRSGGRSLRPLGESPRYFDYCAVKVRRTDRINHPNARIQAELRALTSAGNVKANLLRRGFARSDTVIYLLSDEPDLSYFDGIRKCYTHYFTACDFPALNSLRPPVSVAKKKETTFNMHLLAAIEYEIYKQAKIRFQWYEWEDPQIYAGQVLKSRRRFRDLNAAHTQWASADQGRQSTITIEHVSVLRFLVYLLVSGLKVLLKRSELMRRVVAKARRMRR